LRRPAGWILLTIDNIFRKELMGHTQRVAKRKSAKLKKYKNWSKSRDGIVLREREKYDTT
jgi:hypothetical protein